VRRVFKDKPPRLDLLFQRSNAPVYFVTFNTHTRANLLANPAVHAGFVGYCRRAADFRVGVGRYVLMPDHIHLFACFGIGCATTLSAWIKGLKRELDRVLLSIGHEPLNRPGQKLSSFWQPGFNDHLCAAMKATLQSGSMCSRIRCALDSFVAPKNGRMRVRSRESIERNEWWL